MTGRHSLVLPNVPRCRDLLKPRLRATIGQLLRGQLPWPLLLWGDAGRGKTCAALLMVDAVPSSIYVTLDDLMVDAFERSASIWTVSREALLVVVDELGTRQADWDREYRALKRMADLRDHRPAVWISNHGPEDLQKIYDDRIHSRLCCGTVVELTGLDMRMQG
jgi:DNA replication protein DnaC